VQSLFAQKLLKTASFSSNSTFLEPNPIPHSIKISATEFVTLAKTKGGQNGASEYVLEKYDLNLSPLYSSPLEVGPDEDFIRFFYNDTNLVLLSVIHELMHSKTTLKVYFIDPATGKVSNEKELTQLDVPKWAEVRYKGAVKETFANCINSCQNPNFIIPFQYQIQVKFSPDKSKIFTYIFDYGQRTLIAHTKLYDRNFNLLAAGDVPIDNNFINYGIFPNNKGEVFILNADKLGRVVVVKYNLETKENQLLDIQYSNATRESLVLKVFNDDAVYVANINAINGKMQGIMYAKFNFKTNLIEKINFYALSVGLQQTVSAARGAQHLGEDDWKNYEISDFLINKFEKIILLVEKRELTGANFKYDGTTINDISRWVPKDGKINTGGVMMFAFNKDNDIIWENFYLKSQLVNINTGLLTASFNFDNTAEGKLRIVFATSDNAAGTLNTLKFVEWDEYKGSRLKELTLQNDSKLSLLREYTIWWDDKLLVVGRKGLIGKKTEMNLYELNSGD